MGNNNSNDNNEECKVCSDKPYNNITNKANNRISNKNNYNNKCYAYMHSGCPLNRREVGRTGWALLHTIAAYYPEKPSQLQQTDMERFMKLFMKVYPCGYCSEKSVEECVRNPPRVSSQYELSQWVCEVHNEVNDRMGKPIFDCRNVNERWRNGPTDGSCD